MIDVVGVTFKDKGKVYYFSPGKLTINKNDYVIVVTERGMQYGKAVDKPQKIDKSKLNSELKEILRVANNNDFHKNEKNIDDANSALKKCREIVAKENINMQIIDASYTFDRMQLMFRFIADNRVDFRALAKELASIYKTRIELRQVGARDKAKEISGFGLCGRCLCCSKFLDDLDSVSINMAKNQSISLNPNKINGLCGRLLCCLKYEDAEYTKCKRNLPVIGSKVTTEKGYGRVISVNILKRIYKVDIPDYGVIEVSLDEKN